MSKQLSLFSSPPAYNEGDVVNGKRVVRTRHGDLTMVPVNNKTLATFVSQANAVWNGQYDYTDSVLTNMKEPITIYCPGHDLHFRVAMAQNHIMKHNATGCPVCRYEKQHGQQTHAVETWLRGTGCDYCEGRKFWWPDFERLAREKHGDKYDYSKVVPQKALKDEVTIICPTHGEFRQRADMHLDGWGCKQCSGYPNKKSPEQRCQEWISKCIDKYGPDRYDYSRAHEDYVNNDSLVWIRCCIHDHWFRQTPDNNLRTVNGSCPICSAEFTETQGEAAIRRWLLKHGITNFKQDEVTIEHHNPRCRRQYLRPDFWLPDYNLFIEYNGEQHYEEIDYFNTDDWTFQDQQIRDETLRQYCADPKHFHHLLEIPYWDYSRIDEILTAELKPKC